MEPIIHNLRVISDLTSDSPCSEIKDALKNHNQFRDEKAFPPLIKLLNCFLLLIGKNLCLKKLNTSQGQNICILFFGALISDRLISLSKSRKYVYCLIWARCIYRLQQFAFFNIKMPSINCSLNSHDSIKLKTKFEKTKLIPSPLYVLKSWPGISKNGKRINFPLEAIYHSHGQEFTNLIYESCKDYVSTRRSHSIRALYSFVEFISKHYSEIPADNFLDENISSEFWLKFKGWYFVTKYNNGNGLKLKTLSDCWKEFGIFAETNLFKNNVFAKPALGFPHSVPAYSVRETNTCEINGIQYNNKLTFPIPLHVTDDEAIELIFNRVDSDLAAIQNWAKIKITTSFGNYLESKSLGSKELPPNVKRDSIPPGSALYKHFVSRAHYINGYLTEKDARLARGIYPSPLEMIPSLLGSPTLSTLQPYAFLLIIYHPEITLGFLTELDLYDRHGHLVGFIEGDGTQYLRGYKHRRGPKLSEQKILLNTESAKLVSQLIMITTPVRQYLKLKGNDTWRKLFISCGKGFSHPCKLRTIIYRKNDSVLALELENFGKITADQAVVLANNLSASSVRALSAVKIYIEKESLTEASHALGHKNLSQKLIGRYIPKPLIDFLQRRWIRIFQQAIIFVAMKDSPYLLEATDFSSSDEVNKFLENHLIKFNAIKNTNKDPLITKSSQDETEVIFCINTEILAVLASLENIDISNSSDLNGTIKYWKIIAHHIIQTIESGELNRPDLEEYLIRAKQIVSPSLLGFQHG